MFWLQARSRRFAGVPLGFAVLLKPTCWVLLPLFLMRRRAPMVAQAVFTVVALVLIDFVVIGPRLELAYWTQEANRIVAIDDLHQPVGPDLPASFLQSLPHRDGIAEIDGRAYRETVMTFSQNATVVRPIRAILNKVVAARLSTVAIVLLFGALLAIWGALGQGLSAPFGYDTDLSFLMLGVCCALMFGALTWVMGLVLVLPVVVLIPSMWRSSIGGVRGACLVATMCLVLLGSPEVFPPGSANGHIAALKFPCLLALLGGSLLYSLRRSLCRIESSQGPSHV
jgi:hypothetical protein